MVALDREMVQKLTQLCCIQCTPEEEENLLVNLQDIVTYIEQLQQVDTSSVEPCYHVLGENANAMRDDLVEESAFKDLFFENVPARAGTLVKVPPVITSNG